jgi:hypothetical protein
MAVTTKMSVDVSGFKSGIQQAQQSVKTLDAELKRNEAQFKQTGDREKYLADQTKALNSKISEQQKVVQNAEKALKAMDEGGVKPTDAAYQQMQRTLLNAQTSVAEMTVRMNELGASEQKATGTTEQLVSGLNGINKKVSLDQVVSSVNAITTGLENAAKAALSFARDAWGEIMDIASWADDTLTMATMLGIDQDEMQRMLLVAPQFEISGESLGKTWHKVRMSMTSDSEEVLKAFDRLGVKTHDVFHGAYGDVTGQAGDWKDVFWETGEAIMKVTDEAEQDRLATTLLGKSWAELRPLFSQGREAFEAAMDSQTPASEEAMVNLATLNDTVEELKGKFRTLETEVLGALALTLTQLAGIAGGLIDKVTQFLQTEKGQELLERLGEAVTGMFENLAKIDPEEVVSGFIGVFEELIKGLEFVWENKDAIGNALVTILGIWGTATISSNLLQIIKLVDGVKYLLGGGAAKATGGLLGKLGFGEALKGAAGTALPFIAADAAVIGLAALPAIIAQHADEKRWTEDRERRLEAAESAGDNAGFIRAMANALGPETDGAGNYVRNMFGFMNMRPTDATYDLLMGLESRQGAERAKMMSMIRMYAPETEGSYTTDLLMRYWAGEALDPVVVTALAQNVTDALGHEPVWLSNLDVAPEAAAQISEEIGEVPVEVVPHFRGRWEGYYGGGGGGAGGGMDTVMAMHANGIPFVPRDGYLAILHRGERVLTAGDNRHYTANSNLYIENMNMGGGMDAQALAAAMSAQNRRISAGFGS